MTHGLSILAILLAIGLPLFDFVIVRPRRRPIGGAERGLYVLFAISLLLMALSSIVMLAAGSHMHGWMLMLHMSIAPLFAICIAWLSILWTRMDRGPECEPSCGEKLASCLVLAGSFVTILSAMLLMMTWFGSDGQRALLKVHRVASMILLVAAAFQAGRLLLSPVQHAARVGD